MADILQKIYKPQSQWAMSAADNEWGLSLPESHPFSTPIPQSTFEISGAEEPPVELSATTETPDNIAKILQDIFANNRPTPGRADDIGTALNKMLASQSELNTKAMKQMFQGAVFKTVAAAGDFFTRATYLGAGGLDLIDQEQTNTEINFQNQMDALDNQVLYIKHQMADRFNKTVENNIMTMAAKNLRVTSGNVLELSKDMAQEMTEDMRTAESNARLKKIALEAGVKSARESASYAKTQLWTGLVKSALNLGLMWETGGGTGESWGDLYNNYSKTQKFEDAVKSQEFNKLY